MSATRAPASTNRWVTLVLVCLAQFMVVLDATVVNVALPTIQRKLEFSQANLQWVINGYTLMFGGFLLLGGRAADLIGRKRIFLAGTALFSLASLLNGLSTSGGMLIAFRGLQGLGGALVSPAALSIITTTFAEGQERTRALGVWSAIAAGGGAFGLLLGGVLTETLSWQWIFFVNVPIGIATIVASARLVPESRAAERHSAFDLGGALSVTAGLIVLVYAIVKAQAYGWGSARTLGLVAVALALLAIFIVVERRSAEPLVRLDVFRIRSLAVGNGELLVVAGGLFAMFFFASLYVQEILHYSPLQAGLAFLPLTVSVSASAYGLGSRLLPRVPARGLVVPGLLVAAAGLAVLALSPTHGGYLTTVLPAQVLLGLGMGCVFTPAISVATSGVEHADAGVAAALANTAMQIGGSVGTAFLNTVAVTATAAYAATATTGSSNGDALVQGYDAALTWAAIVVTAVAAVAFVLLRPATPDREGSL
jgi:EmrB/QacA subfamily drug resistance transporter